MIKDNRSLVEASKNRVAGEDTTLYARGMLLAFFTDLQLLKRSGGNRDIASIFRSIFEKYRNPASVTDGNKAVLEAIGSREINNYVENGGALDWTSAFQSAGIEIVGDGPGKSLRVMPKLSGAEKRILDRLGYNNWRKLPITPK